MNLEHWWATLKLDTTLGELECFEKILLVLGLICLLAITIILPRDFFREVKKMRDRRASTEEKTVEIPQAPEEMR